VCISGLLGFSKFRNRIESDENQSDCSEDSDDLQSCTGTDVVCGCSAVSWGVVIVDSIHLMIKEHKYQAKHVNRMTCEGFQMCSAITISNPSYVRSITAFETPNEQILWHKTDSNQASANDMPPKLKIKVIALIYQSDNENTQDRKFVSCRAEDSVKIVDGDLVCQTQQ
jgi:hypothetical protein